MISPQGLVRINVREILDQILEVPVMKRTLSLRAEYVIQILHVLAHECGHAHQIYKLAEKYRTLEHEEREQMADEFAQEMYILIAETFDIEPEALKDEPYLMSRLSELFITRGGEELFRRERRLIAEGYIYEDEAGRKYATLREFIHRKFAEGRVWRQSTYPVRVVFNKNEKGETPMFIQDQDVAGEGAEFIEDSDVQVDVSDIPDDGIGYAEDESLNYEDNHTEPAAAPAISTAVAPISMNPQEVPMTTGLTLPAHIAALMNAGASGAAATANAQTPPAVQPKVYPPNNYPAEKLIEFMTEVYKRVYFHIFNECAWTGTPVAGATDWHFENAAAVIAKPVNISDLIHQFGMPDVIMAYNTHDAQGRKQYGQWAEKCQNGIVRGEVFKKTGLPAYTFYCNFYGNQYIRKLIPENPAKDSTYGSRARGGECLAWAIADEKGKKLGTDGKPIDDPFLGHFANGVWVPKKR